MKPKFSKLNMAIPSQATEGKGSVVGVETRRVSPNNKPALRAPRNSYGVEDIVQAGGKPSGNLLLGRNIANQLGVLETKAGSLMAKTITFTALPPAPKHMRVLGRVGVPLRTMGFDSLPCAVIGKVCPPHVLKMGNGFNVIWANAAPVSTGMVWLVPLRQWPMQPFVNPTVSVNRSFRSVRTTADSEDAITVWVDESRPHPTTVRLWRLLDLGPEAIFNGGAFSKRRSSWHASIIAPHRNNRNIQIKLIC